MMNAYTATYLHRDYTPRRVMFEYTLGKFNSVLHTDPFAAGQLCAKEFRTSMYAQQVQLYNMSMIGTRNDATHLGEPLFFFVTVD